MSTAGCIEQKGVIEHIEDGHASVKLTTFTACATCHSKSACGVGEDTTRNVDVILPDNSYAIGEQVMISMKRHLGMRAAFLAYILPFMIVIFGLILFTSFHMSELLAGILSLLILVPYFIFLFLFRDRLDRTFTFTLRKAV